VHLCTISWSFSTFVSPDTVNIYQQCRLVVLCVCSVWSSVFSHMICLDTYIAVDFDLLRLYHLFSRMSVPLFRTRQAIIIIIIIIIITRLMTHVKVIHRVKNRKCGRSRISEGHTSHTVCSGQLRQLCHVSSYTPVVPACCIHSLSVRLSLPSASHIAFLFVYFHFDDASS